MQAGNDTGGDNLTMHILIDTSYNESDAVQDQVACVTEELNVSNRIWLI